MPDKVRDMRDAILAAAATGDVEALRTPLEWNELKPEVSARATDDPIAYWRQVSGDGQGREILAILSAVIEAGHAVRQVGGKAGVAGGGKGAAKTEVYVWPRFAEADLDKLSPADEVALYRLIKPAELKAMRQKRRWTWYRLLIGADGTWHSFQREDE